MITEIAHAAAHLPTGHRFRLVARFLRFMCEKSHVKGRILAFREARLREVRLSRFKMDNIRFCGRLRNRNKSAHVVVLVEHEKLKRNIMFSTQRDAPILEIIDIDRVSAIRFLIWVGAQISKSHGTDELWTVWIETIIPTCMRDVGMRETPIISQNAWKSDQTLPFQAAR